MKARLFAAALAAAVLLGGCGKEEEEGELAYEQPLNTLRLAVNYCDEDSYLNVWLPWEKERFTASDEWTEGFLERAYDRSQYDGKLSLKINSAEPMPETELDELEQQTKEQYGVRPDFAKGMKVSAELRVYKGKDVMSDPREFELVRLENNWYICGETITGFSFTAS